MSASEKYSISFRITLEDNEWKARYEPKVYVSRL